MPCFVLLDYGIVSFLSYIHYWLYQKLMKWSIWSTQEIFGLFITIAFIHVAFKDVGNNFRDNYYNVACDEKYVVIHNNISASLSPNAYVIGSDPNGTIYTHDTVSHPVDNGISPTVSVVEADPLVNTFWEVLRQILTYVEIETSLKLTMEDIDKEQKAKSETMDVNNTQNVAGDNQSQKQSSQQASGKNNNNSKKNF